VSSEAWNRKNLFFAFWVAFLFWGVVQLQVDHKKPQNATKNFKKSRSTIGNHKKLQRNTRNGLVSVVASNWECDIPK